MNKKLKAFTAIVIIIQLLVPVYLLAHHYSIRKYTEENTEEYKFRLEYLMMYNDYNDISKEKELMIRYYIDGMSYNFGTTAGINIGTDGFAHVTKKDADKALTDVWFSKKYYKSHTTLSPAQYSFEPSADVVKLQKELANKKFYANETTSYITAKVYKGIFIPTAIYYNGEKIITISL